MKKFRKAVALLLVVCMLTSGNMSLFANAAESNSVSEIGTDMFYRVFHLDAARKYFSAAEIKELIDIAAEGGYNQFELYLADNQGFRLALNDMTVTTTYGTYDLTPSLGAGYDHSPHYTDGKNLWLTQAEMDSIIEYASSKGIGIVPCINAPGHMGAILESFSEFWYTSDSGLTSHSALDVENPEAYAFGQALIEKYATYFESRGVKYLNIGADEYGADLLEDGDGTNNGMDLLYNEDNYTYFVDFVNDAAETIKDLGMTPRAYNDCIYYNNLDTYNGQSIYFDTDIEICYWNGGWSWSNWFRRADATYLAGKGFKMINTNGDYYHVLGYDNQFEDAQSVLGFDINDFHIFDADSDYKVNIDNPAGAMFCIWCDDARDVGGPNTGTTEWVIENSRDAIIAFGQNVLSQKAPVTKTVELEVGQTYTETFKGKPTVAYEAMDPTIAEQTTTVNEGEKEVGDVVEGTVTSGEYYLGNGSKYLNANGNRSPVMVGEEDAKPWTVTISDGVATIKQGDYYLYSYRDTTYGLQCVIGTETPAEYAYKFGTDNKLYVDYTYDGNEYYIYWYESGTNKWMAGETYGSTTTAYLQPYEVIDPTTTTITFDANKKGTTYAYIGDVEYTINVTSDEPELQTEVIDLKEGETVGITVDGDVCIDYDTEDTTVATVTTSLDDGKVPGNMFTDSMVAGEYYLYDGDRYLIERNGSWAMVDAAEALPWTVTIDGTTGAATITQGDNYYLTTIQNTTTGYFDVKILKDQPAKYPLAFDNKANNALYLMFTDGNDYYIYWDTQWNGYLGARTTTEVAYFSPYTVEVGVDPATNIVFEGKKEGTTYVTIGNVRYTINVSAAEVVEPDPEPGVDKVITIEVGESYTWPDLIAGDVTGDHPTKDTTIATVIAAPGAVETTYSVGNPVTSTMVAGTYYLGNGNGYYLNIENGYAQFVSEQEAKPWTITLSGDAATFKQGDYYLSNTTGTNTFGLKISTTNDAALDFKFGTNNGIYLTATLWSVSNDYYLNYADWGGLGANEDAQATAFRPYEVVENKITTATSLTFRGHKVGTTFVTIDGVTYQINVTKGEKVIEVIEGEYIEITANGVITGTYPTDDTKIATATVVGPGEPIKVVGSEVTTAMVSGEYYIGAGDRYLIVKDGKFAMVGADEAIPWDVEMVSGSTAQSAIIKQGEYYFSNESDGNGGYYIRPLTSEPTYETRFDSYNDLYIVSPDSGVWHFVRWKVDGNSQYVGAAAHPTEGGDALIPEYFGPYSVETTTSETTVLSFYGRSEGETYVTIGDVDYTIKVIKNDNLNTKEIELEVNQIYDKIKISGDVSGVYLTDDTTIATVTTTLGIGETTLSFYGRGVGKTTVIIGDTKYVITVIEEKEETINITIPLGEEVVYKQPANVADVDLPEDEYVDIDLLYRRQDGYTWVANPQANQGYYIMGIEQHYLAIEDGKFITVEEPTEDHKWTVIPKVDGFSLKYGDYYLVNHWHDGKMTLEFLEEDTSAFPWQFDQNRGIYCTDKVVTYRLAHNPNTHEWELNDKTTRRIGFSEVEINEGAYATEITFVGKQVGNTEVKIGNKTYNITVTEAEVPEMKEVYIEYWITNNRCVNTDDDETTNEFYGDDRYTVSYDNPEVSTEEGMMIGGLLAQNAARLDQQTLEPQDEHLILWKTSINADGYKQEVGQVARTTSGTFFDRIRFWHGKWSVSGDGEAWRILESTDQLVAYYIQETDVTQEVITYAMDWGHAGATDPTTGYQCVIGEVDYSYVLLDFAVQYESGTRTPNTFPLAETIGFHCTHGDVAQAVHQDIEGYYYRELGVIQAEAIEGFEVYMITLTPHTDDKKVMLTDINTNPTTITSYAYEGTEKVVWVDDEANLGAFTDSSLHADGYHVGGTAYVPQINIYEHQAMLVTYYVRAVPLESAIDVHYHDATGLYPGNLEAAPEFYMYNISVKEGTVFPEGIDIVDGKLSGATVNNFIDKPETVTSVLSAMPAIPVQYRYGKYEFVEFALSNDKTELHLYYTSTEPIYVVDFGLSVNVDLGLKENATAEILAQPTFGTAVIKDGILTYEPTKVLRTIDSIVVKITEAGNAEEAINTYRFYPATTVYYEEEFMNIDGSSWSEAGTAISNKQTTTELGEFLVNPGYNYGYDESYNKQGTGASNGTYLVSTDPSGYAEFTFTGTGVDIYANCTPTSGSINVLVRNVSTNKLVKMLQINTKMAEEGSATTGQAVNAFNIPVASIDFGTAHDTYTVQIRHIKTVVNNEPTWSEVQLDGFRVYNTLSDSNVYKVDFEANPTFVEMRDMIFGGFGTESIAAAVKKEEGSTSAGSDYFENYTAEQLAEAMTQVLDLSEKPYGIVIDTNNGVLTQDVQDLLDNGPKNEVYLFADQTLTFTPSAGNVQIGLKAINAEVTYQINGGDPIKLTTSTDMFYELGEMDSNTTVTITNNSENGGILSITDLKWIPSDGTSVASDEAFVPLTEEDFVTTFRLMGFRSSTPDPEPEPEEPVVEEEILYQTNNNSTDVRLIAYLDDLSEYEKVAFTLTIDGRTSKELVCSTAYAELYAGGELYTTEDIYGVDGYFVTYTINRYLEVYAGKEVTITVTYTTVTGETVTAERTVTIE